jgi:UDP-N-acetylmuramate--alanine ligase
MYKKINKIHLIGIGGIGMSGIAELLMRNGYSVSGSDLSRTGHSAENIAGAELVVFSSAIRPDNPELVAAKEQGIPTIPRAEMLAELMRLKYGIAVAGAHGKTTTTSMISTVLMEAGLDPTIVVGGRLDNFGGTNARLGGGEFMVVEADESDGSFNKLTPSIAIVTNMDREHMDYYQTMGRLRKAFLSFLNKVPFYGLCVFCGDDPYLRMLQPRVTRRKKTYGFSPHNTYRIENYTIKDQGTECRVVNDNSSETLRLQVPGRHNVLNALAALAVADELSIPRAHTLKGLAAFQGVQRRFQKRGEIKGVVFIDDYAHHPSEIRATLAAARERYPEVKIRVVFQPHRYSRVEDLFEHFSTCFVDCDAIAITDIYAAGEAVIPGVESSFLIDRMKRQGINHGRHIPKAIDGVEAWLAESQPGDIILTLGAGDLANVYKQLF